jgi:hypothetical protein
MNYGEIYKNEHYALCLKWVFVKTDTIVKFCEHGSSTSAKIAFQDDDNGRLQNWKEVTFSADG